jgi:hypothetical protein
MANILIASLGESPVVVPVMYHLLKKRKGIEIDEVHVLAPKGGMVPLGYDLVEETLLPECTLKRVDLGFEDANTPQACLQFLQILANLLTQQQQHNVYLSLAGGRKSMAALIAWVVPFFPCVKGLYHVIDPDKDNDAFPSVEEIYNSPSNERERLMNPTEEERERLRLVTIPFNREQQMSSNILSRLLALTEEDLEKLEKLQEEDAEVIWNAQRFLNGDKILEVLITKPAQDQYDNFAKTDESHAQSIRNQYFKKMYSATTLHSLLHHLNDDNGRSGSFTLHFCKSDRTDIRPIIYTRPKDIAASNDVEQVVVCGFEIEDEGKKPYPYGPLKKIKISPQFSLEPVGPIDKRQPPEDIKKEHILLGTLGTRPMIATQLHTLLTKEGVSIPEIVLFYPALSRKILDGVQLLERVIKEENRRPGKKISLRKVEIAGREDIDSDEACIDFQQHLENEIERIQHDFPDKRVLLSLSGGRKGMTAMSIFAAQKKGLPYVYHTLISDEKLSKKIDEQTTVEALNNPRVTPTERNNRLFLRSYGMEQFTLFRVPVLSQKQLLAL